MEKVQIEEQEIDMSLLLPIFKGHEKLIPPDKEDQAYLLMLVKARIGMAKGDSEISKAFAAAYREKGRVLSARLAQQIRIIHQKIPLPVITTVVELA